MIKHKAADPTVTQPNRNRPPRKRPEKMIVSAKARKAMPDSANRPKTKVTGSTKKNTRMQPVLSD